MSVRRGLRRRRLVLNLVLAIVVAGVIFFHPDNYQQTVVQTSTDSSDSHEQLATDALATLSVKGRASKTGYSRAQFGDGWSEENGCDTRNIILARDMTNVISSDCVVTSGTLDDPYTGKIIDFVRGASTSGDVQIDHVVALSNAWQTGAAYWSSAKRETFANDPLELLAVDGSANQQKSDGDAATWLPSNKSFRCQYVARQIAVKSKYDLWVTQAERDAITRILSSCPSQRLPVGSSRSTLSNDE